MNLAIKEETSKIASKMLARQDIIRQIRRKTLNTLDSRGVWEMQRQRVISEIEESALRKGRLQSKQTEGSLM